MYRSFSANLFTTSSTILSCSSSVSIPTIMSSIKLATFPVLMRSYKILFIIVWKVVSEFVNPKNITISSKDPSSMVNAAFHLSLSFICTLLYPHLKSIFVNTFLYLVFYNVQDEGQRIIILNSLFIKIPIVLYYILFIKNTGAIWGDFEGLMHSFLNCSDMNLHISSLSFFDSRYTFLFFGMNSSFILIAWFYGFLVSIHLLAFFPKT